jgi:hypothetical protein
VRGVVARLRLGDFPSVSHNVTFAPVSAVETRSKGYGHFHRGGPSYFTHDNKGKASIARRALLASPRIRGAGRRSVGSGEERRAILLPWDCENTSWRRSSRTLAASCLGLWRHPSAGMPYRSAAGMLWIDRPVFAPCTHAVRAGLGCSGVVADHGLRQHEGTPGRQRRA